MDQIERNYITVTTDVSMAKIEAGYGRTKNIV